VTQEKLDNQRDVVKNEFETVGGISASLANLVIYRLPDTYFNDYIRRINSVTAEDVKRVAIDYLDPSKMVILVVGDRNVIEPRLKELGLPITILDPDGNRIAK